MNCLLTELDLPHVKATDANNAVVFVDDCRRLSLSLGQDDVYKVLVTKTKRIK